MTFLLVVRQSYHCSVETKKSPRFRRPSSLSAVHAAIIGCERCPRLRSYCRAVAAEKRAAYRDWDYWGKPVPGFGDPKARILILGLAPAAHGANRTGRVFTGDGVGGSGDFLMAALHRAGFANLPTSHHPDDGLALSERVHRRSGPVRASGQQADTRRGERPAWITWNRNWRIFPTRHRRRARQDCVGRVAAAARRGACHAAPVFGHDRVPSATATPQRSTALPVRRTC